MRNNFGLILLSIPILCAFHVTDAAAQTPDPAMSYFVPEAGPVSPPIVGSDAIAFFHACPNNHGSDIPGQQGTSLPNNARVRVILRTSAGDPAFAPKESICIEFRGGTPAQGFTTGSGSDSIIANSTWNQTPRCPNVRCLQADADPVGGIAYITFAGASPSNPGVTLRDPCRKWGHYDSSLPVLVNGVPIQGRLTDTPGAPAYVLMIKNMDWAGGLTAALNQGEIVSALDFNGIASGMYIDNAISFAKDLDWDGVVDIADFNLETWHVTHDCDTPNNDAGGCP
jgi:hypothetical protein